MFQIWLIFSWSKRLNLQFQPHQKEEHFTNMMLLIIVKGRCPVAVTLSPALGLGLQPGWCPGHSSSHSPAPRLPCRGTGCWRRAPSWSERWPPPCARWSWDGTWGRRTWWPWSCGEPVGGERRLSSQSSSQWSEEPMISSLTMDAAVQLFPRFGLHHGLWATVTVGFPFLIYLIYLLYIKLLWLAKH